MSNICAAIGRGQLVVLETNVALRRAIHDFYSGLFLENENVTLLKNLRQIFIPIIG